MFIDFRKINGGGGGGEYVLPKATSTKLGGIKVGENLSIDANGVLSATGGGEGSKDVYFIDFLDRTATGGDTDWAKFEEMYNRAAAGDFGFILNAKYDGVAIGNLTPWEAYYEDYNGVGIRFHFMYVNSEGKVEYGNHSDWSDFMVFKNEDAHTIRCEKISKTIENGGGGGSVPTFDLEAIFSMSDEGKAAMFPTLKAAIESGSFIAYGSVEGEDGTLCFANKAAKESDERVFFECYGSHFSQPNTIMVRTYRLNSDGRSEVENFSKEVGGSNYGEIGVGTFEINSDGDCVGGNPYILFRTLGEPDNTSYVSAIMPLLYKKTAPWGDNVVVSRGYITYIDRDFTPVSEGEEWNDKIIITGEIRIDGVLYEGKWKLFSDGSTEKISFQPKA